MQPNVYPELLSADNVLIAFAAVFSLSAFVILVVILTASDQTGTLELGNNTVGQRFGNAVFVAEDKVAYVSNLLVTQDGLLEEVQDVVFANPLARVENANILTSTSLVEMLAEIDTYIVRYEATTAALGAEIGVPNMGTFMGTIITNNVTAKEAMCELDIALANAIANPTVPTVLNLTDLTVTDSTTLNGATMTGPLDMNGQDIVNAGAVNTDALTVNTLATFGDVSMSGNLSLEANSIVTAGDLTFSGVIGGVVAATGVFTDLTSVGVVNMGGNVIINVGTLTTNALTLNVATGSDYIMTDVSGTGSASWQPVSSLNLLSGTGTATRIPYYVNASTLGDTDFKYVTGSPNTWQNVDGSVIIDADATGAATFGALSLSGNLDTTGRLTAANLTLTATGSGNVDAVLANTGSGVAAWKTLAELGILTGTGTATRLAVFGADNTLVDSTWTSSGDTLSNVSGVLSCETVTISQDVEIASTLTTANIRAENDDVKMTFNVAFFADTLGVGGGITAGTFNAPTSNVSCNDIFALSIISAANGISTLNGDIISTNGDIVATLGDVAGVTMTVGAAVTAGTGITATTGDITAVAGNLVATSGTVQTANLTVTTGAAANYILSDPAGTGAAVWTDPTAIDFGGTLNRLIKSDASGFLTDASISDDGATVTFLTDTVSQGNLTIASSQALQLGSSPTDNLTLTHDSSNGTITNSAGDLTLENTDSAANVVVKLSGTTSTHKFRVVNSANAELVAVNGAGSIVYTPGAGEGKLLTSNASGVGTWELRNCAQTYDYYLVSSPQASCPREISSIQDGLGGTICVLADTTIDFTVTTSTSVYVSVGVTVTWAAGDVSGGETLTVEGPGNFVGAVSFTYTGDIVMKSVNLTLPNTTVMSNFEGTNLNITTGATWTWQGTTNLTGCQSTSTCAISAINTTTLTACNTTNWSVSKSSGTHNVTLTNCILALFATTGFVTDLVVNQCRLGALTLENQNALTQTVHIASTTVTGSFNLTGTTIYTVNMVDCLLEGAATIDCTETLLNFNSVIFQATSDWTLTASAIAYTIFENCTFLGATTWDFNTTNKLRLTNSYFTTNVNFTGATLQNGIVSNNVFSGSLDWTLTGTFGQMTFSNNSVAGNVNFDVVVPSATNVCGNLMVNCTFENSTSMTGVVLSGNSMESLTATGVVTGSFVSANITGLITGFTATEAPAGFNRT